MCSVLLSAACHVYSLWPVLPSGPPGRGCWCSVVRGGHISPCNTGLEGGCTWLYSGLIKAKHIMLKHSQLSPGPRPPLSWRWWWEGAELQTSFHSQLALKSPPETMKTHCGWRQILSTSSSRSRVLFDHHSYTPVVRGKGHFNIWAVD